MKTTILMFFLTIVVSLVNACSTMKVFQAYGGKPQPDKETIVIKQKRFKPGNAGGFQVKFAAIITAIDGEPVDTNNFDEVVFLPGTYKIDVLCGLTRTAGLYGQTLAANTLMDKMLADKGRNEIFRDSETTSYNLTLKAGENLMLSVYTPGLPSPPPKTSRLCWLFNI